MSTKPTSDNLQLNYLELVEKVKALVDNDGLLLNRIEAVTTPVMIDVDDGKIVAKFER